ncbi:Ig-like domain-containing protein [Marinobacter zhejiangensis]|uniref:Ig-like domain-containing protein n=1 Tax=Marinobacter zhejiangensis TaxID=488535 RepID=A0A1I4MGV0_9GAMM|nr:Ig-like domain-containing protein [Marinobacter zhejiangensis]SFM02479.1 Ig-like domain-containing protein [Marinobacter zhejiangensis]
MKYNKILALGPALLLAACGGSEQTMKEPVEAGYTVYSFPADGQREVSPIADIVLRFSHAITDENITSKIQLSDGNALVPVTAELVDGGHSIKLSPVGKLNPATDYTITFDGSLDAAGNRAIATPNAFGPEGIQFSTRAEQSGIQSLDNLSSEFAVEQMIPSADGFFRPMDFSTFRLRLTQPVHPQWQQLGGSITLRDGAGEAVPATVLVNGRYITIDPCTTDDKAQCGLEGDALNPGANYSVEVANLQNLAGEQLNYSHSFTPRETSPTVILYQETIDSGLLAGQAEADAQHSLLNGAVINGVTLNSTLMGTSGPSQQTGGLYAELAYAPSFPGDDPVPLRVPKGSVLISSSLDVNVGGVVPVIKVNTNSIQTTGDIRVTMLSDATGYLYPNPYSNSVEAPRHVKLFMDVSMNTAEAQPNASLSQDLLGVELSGIAIVKDGVLTIDAIGMVEPNLLGQEFADSTIAFHIEADTNLDVQLNALDNRIVDTTGPQLVSWMPGAEDATPSTRQSMQRPGDPVILFFDEPLDNASIPSGVSLIADGIPVETLHTQLDGTALTLNPEGGLKHGVNYQVVVNGLTDLAGNLATVNTLNFTLDPLANTVERPPLALTTYPGFPCETNFAALDLNNGVLGSCYANSPGHNKGAQPIVDVLPVSAMPADRPITVVFSQSMDLASINENTFVVEKVVADANGKPLEGETTLVAGRFEKSLQQVRFFPNQPWEPGNFYRYTMKSQQDPTPTTCTQEPRTSVCGANGLALKTDILEGLNDSGSGADDLVIYFEGSEPQESVFTALRNFPVRDTNSNFLIDCDSSYNDSCPEPFEAAHTGSDTDGWAAAPNSTKLAVINGTADAGLLGAIPGRVGCEAGKVSLFGADHPDCPRDKFIYQTYALNTEVKGPGVFDPTPEAPNSGDELEGMLVDLYPTALTTSSISVFTQLNVLGILLQEESVTNTQVLRMRYAKDDPSCVSNCSRNSLIPGIIATGDNGQPQFVTNADLLIDAPDMEIPLGGTHDLYGRPFTLELRGNVTFLDDGRMQVEQRNTNRVGENDELLVTADALGVSGFGLVQIKLPLEIPVDGQYLNFISNPVKNLPAQQ